MTTTESNGVREVDEARHFGEERLRVTFEQAAVGIATADLEGRYIDMNRRFCELLGYSAAELRGLSFADVTHAGDLARSHEHKALLLSGEASEYRSEKRYVRRDGTQFWALTTVSLLRDEAGRPLRFIGVIDDITDRKEAERQLREAQERHAAERERLLEAERSARAEAERASRMKDEFLATLSHELRTPLTSILGWAHLMRIRPPTSEELAKGLEIVERNARVQTQLIEDLLDMNRITSGKLRLDVKPLMPVALIEAALETVRPAADAKAIRVECALDPVAGPIPGDPARLQQVAWNLLNNAIKFTPPGGTVRVVLRPADAHVEMSVSDNGVGMDPRFLEHVFERFRQADSSTTREFGGLGLGLAIVKQLVELHGGTVSAASAGPGQGSTFSVLLPLADVRVRGEPARHEDGSPPEFQAVDLRGVRVLAVDDQRDACELVERVLEECGAWVVTAPGGQSALELLPEARPDVLIADIGMPDMDGYELLRRVRALQDAGLQRIPAIAMTAFARTEDRTRALHSGFQVHIAKPVEPSELVATVASVTGRNVVRL
jgi:PAS domain S-box-containing protein